MKKKIALCVAEKPTVAKSVAEFLSRGRFNKYSSASKFNPIFEFDYQIGSQPYMLRVTSVLGHIMGYKFPDDCKNWLTTNIENLYHIPLEKIVLEQNVHVVKNIQQSVKDADELILWLDCDREGEAIAFDVIDACMKSNRRIHVQRAHFSALTKEDIERAVQNLTDPNKNLSDAVRVRQEIDLRIGATFTRFQTLNFREILLGSAYNTGHVLSYGPCQFPTLGFIVERFKVIRDFVPEKFWSLTLKYGKQVNGKFEEVKFDWGRQRLFDKLSTLILFEKCEEAGKARITDIVKSKKTRTRPHPLNTIEAQKLISRKLRIASAQAMEIMEKLYQRGILSYPRTETNVFNPTINLRKIVDELVKNDEFGEFAQKVAAGTLWGGPKNGKQDDKAHPPIHPVKHASKNELAYDEWRIYELIARHFLATISKDAVGAETKIEVMLGGEHFTARGLIIEEYNWLEVFHYEKWSDSTLPPLNKGEEFKPNLVMTDGETKAPALLTEADLIGKMDQNGIGTDATIHEHIKTVQERNYVVKQNQSFVPTPVGVNLIEAYEHLGIELYKPYLRAQMENDMKLIAQGIKSKDSVLRDCIVEMKRIYQRVHSSSAGMKHFLMERMKTGGTDTAFQQVLNNAQKFQPNVQAPSTGGGHDKPGGGSGGAAKTYNSGGGQTYNSGGGKTYNNNNANAKPAGGGSTEEQKQQPTFQLGNTEFGQCPTCKKASLKVKTSRAGSLFIACMGYPSCNKTMSLPRALEQVTMIDDSCKSCMTREKKKVQKFRLEFVTDFVNEAMNEVLPDDDNTSGIFCVMEGCDPKYKVLLDATFGMQNKRTYDNAFQANPNGVPNYYHQKPQNVPQGNGTGVNGQQKRRKMNDGKPQPENAGGYSAQYQKPKENDSKKNNQGGAAGRTMAACNICGKKRHVKESDCPNNKNKK